MIIISHRGNLNGPDKGSENDPLNLECVIHSTDFDVEVDLWNTDYGWFLGHDSPDYPVELEWILEYSPRLWFHVKNPKCMVEIYKNEHLKKYLNFFAHDKDWVTITSRGHLWGYPGQNIEGSILVLPEWNGDDVSGAYGICTDYPLKYEDSNLHSDV